MKMNPGFQTPRLVLEHLLSLPLLIRLLVFKREPRRPLISPSPPANPSITTSKQQTPQPHRRQPAIHHHC
ncbi:hypothetical protein I7I53_09627 [Histoplasma capsulatum var. duboisii H88]|uniref:Uncharacterized protein n=1 Tax=Ajellomyces capsulatus (strain H88) TaxID=544711 RepID=A0A8A1L6R3_AJEC8|nr:hypothetical protein I7I53_09627 [Histoplasma capsulatum var. duboisii H88]